MALIISAGPVLAAPSAEERAFAVALEKFHTFPDSSEKDFANFVQKYPNSIHVPEAIWYQAQARLLARQTAGAIELLATNENRAGNLAPQYLYWLGRAHFQNHDFANATNTWGEMLRKYPDSPQALDATIREADAFVRLEQWRGVVQLLDRTNGLFQQSVRGGAVSETIASGFLLLGEAQLALGDFTGVNRTMELLNKQTLNTDLKWQRDYLAARLQRAEGHLEDALRTAATLLTTEDKTNRAEGVTFEAGLLEQTGDFAAAINAYTNNLASGVPAAQQRLAILKITELDLKRNDLANAAQRLENFLEQFPAPEPTDLAMLTLGEIRLRQALDGSSTNPPAGQTNAFQNALEQFNKILTSFTNSPLVGRAYLDKGWCLWSQGKIQESQEAFRNATELLPFSEEQAEARFKWADTQFEARDFADAVTNYNVVAEKYASLPGAREHHLIERALYQSGRAALEQHDPVAATSALKNLLEWYPDGFAGPSLLLLTGQGLAEQKNPAEARQLFAEFEQRYPTNSLMPEVRLAIARSYEQEGDWNAAVTNYEAWTAAFPHHYLMPQATFSIASDEYMAGHETNALALFTSFISRFPTTELAQRAQWWVGDYYFRQGDYVTAEKNYQLVFQNTNWPPSELTYRAWMMAGSSSMARFNYKEAIYYFTNLWRPDVPRDLQVQATMAYADATISQDSTNKAQDLNDAIRTLQTIPQAQSNTWEAAQAWGRIADCYYNLGATDPNQFTNAARYYRKVFESPHALKTAVDEARFKLGDTIEKEAAQQTGTNQTALLKMALNQYVNAFYEGLHDTEQPSPFWTKKSGLAAAQLAESLQEWQSAYDVYKQLEQLLPVLAPSCERRMARIAPMVPHP